MKMIYSTISWIKISNTYFRFYLENSASIWWTEVFEPIFSEASDGGTIVTTAEFYSVLKSPLPSNATIDMVRRLVLRYNDSFYSWGKGDFTIKEGGINFEKLQQIENRIDDYENEAKQVLPVKHINSN